MQRNAWNGEIPRETNSATTGTGTKIVEQVYKRNGGKCGMGGIVISKLGGNNEVLKMPSLKNWRRLRANEN